MNKFTKLKQIPRVGFIPIANEWQYKRTVPMKYRLSLRMEEIMKSGNLDLMILPGEGLCKCNIYYYLQALLGLGNPPAHSAEWSPGLPRHSPALPGMEWMPSASYILFFIRMFLTGGFSYMQEML